MAGLKVCIYGAGAIGGHLAARFDRGGAQVSLVARGAQLAAVRERGLRVQAADGVLECRPVASADPADLGVQDAVVVTTKTHAYAAVAAGIGPLLGPRTEVLFMGNGIPWWYFIGHGGVQEGRSLPLLDPGDALRRAIGGRRVLGGVAYSACSMEAPGEITVRNKQSRFVIGAAEGARSDCATALVGALLAGGCGAEVSHALREQVWRKLVTNLAGASMSVLTHTPVSVNYAEPVLAGLIRELIAEGAAVARAMGFDLPSDADHYLAPLKGSLHRSSTLQDLEAGRPMEIDALFQVPLQLAAEHGVAVPTLARLVALVVMRARAAGVYGSPPA